MGDMSNGREDLENDEEANGVIMLSTAKRSGGEKPAMSG